jgi:hypothetical protein
MTALSAHITPPDLRSMTDASSTAPPYILSPAWKLAHRKER